MPLRMIRLSGYSSSDPKGRIVIDTAIMTPQALDRTKSGCLCWSDIRFLDDAFGKSLVIDANGIEYRKGLRTSAGRHLFSILTGKKIFPGPGQQPYRITNNVNSPAILVEGGMSFPNAYKLDATSSDYYSLASLQIDSKYGHFCDGQWNTSLKYNGPHSGDKSAMTLPGFFASFAGMLNADTTLCNQDKKDIYAHCVLQYWSIFYTGIATARSVSLGASSLAASSVPTSFTVNSLDGNSASLPVPVPVLPAKFSSYFRRVALDYALMSPGLSTFVAVFGISPSYGANTFPHIP